MSKSQLDRAVAAIRDEHVDERVVRSAAGRVFRNLFDSSFLPEQVDRIRGCSDFQALIPSYLDQTLAPARVLLLRDHTSQCVACRRVVQQAQGRGLNVIDRPGSKVGDIWVRRMPILAWAIAATLVIGIALGVTAGRYGLLPGQSTLRLTVASVEGKLYRVSDIGCTLIKAGAVLANGDQFRTASGARAILRIFGGGELELAPESEISVSRGWQGTTVNVEEGRMIVQTLDTPVSKLYVLSGGILVPVNNVLLSVDKGLKGTRIAVAKGSARVQRGQSSFQVAAGQQMATGGLESVSIASQFAWSENAGSYLALLGEFSNLQKQFQGIPSPDLRYSSNLAKYVPGDAVLYAAVPNLGGTIAEAKRIFDDRLAQSDVLRDWWGQGSASRSSTFDRVISQISSVSQYLGDEIVFSMLADGANRNEPLLLAEVRRPGLAEYLRQNLPASAGVELVDGPSEPSASSGGRLLVSITNNILVASTDAVQLRRGAQLIQNPASGSFTKSPFYSRIAQSYASGIAYLLAVDLEQSARKSVSSSKEQTLAGVNNAQYLVLERRDESGGTETRASLSFSSARQGVASWLGAPGPMSSLEFVSPDASLAASFVMKSPRVIVEELVAASSQQDPGFSQGMNEFESQAGVKILDDIAALFGSDVTFAIDGPLLPIPSWKLVIEVYDPSRLQQTLQTVVDRFNQQSSDSQDKLQLGSQQINSRVFYWLRSDKFRGLAAYYTFVDGYLLAAPSEALLTQAIQNRQTGYTLASSANFRNQLPTDSYTNFSGILYTHPGSSLGPLANELKRSGSLTAAQQQSVSVLLANSGPGLICIYGEPDRIVAASRGSFLGFGLGTLSGIQQGGPLLPLIASSAHSVTAQMSNGTPPQQK